MDSAALKTLQIVAVQHELAMVIGLNLDLDRMLRKFMQTCLRRLSLRRIHFFLDVEQRHETDEPGTFSWRLSLPSMDPDKVSEATLSSLAARVAQNAQSVAESGDDSRFYVAFPLPGIGCVVLERAQRNVDADVVRALEPIFERLAISCVACLEHRRILDEVAARKIAEAQILHQVRYDSLTDLPNRKTLQERLRQSVAAARRHGHHGAVLFIDLDRFKNVNDTLGHSAGDAVLVAFAERLREEARDDDTLARVGGDEFILLASDLGDTREKASEGARRLAERIAELMAAPIEIKGASLHVSTSIGMAIYPEVECAAGSLTAYCDALVQFADTAMYRAKQHGRDGYQFFSPDMQAAASYRHRLEMSLRHALVHDELSLNYQILVSPTYEVIAGEALLRWHHPDLGAVSPEAFIPVAEEAGLILAIGAWVLETACGTIAQIVESNAYPHFQYLSVNVSPREMKSPDFVDRVIKTVQRSGIDPGHLRLELTESAFIDNMEEGIATMQKLVDFGMKFSLDDFGTGYSSLSYLHRLPVATLKIDRSFITGIDERIENQAIVDATVAMASHLQIDCIVEGVETTKDVGYFSDKPIHAMQGFHFSRPLPEHEFLELLSGRFIESDRSTAA